ICVCLSPALAVYGQLNTVTGFRGEDARKQFELEKEFDKHLDAENIGNTIRMYSAKPHHLGSAGSKEVADSIYNRLKAYGWNPRMETYQVLFPTPTLRRLEMIAPRKYTALLSEPLLKEDHSIGQAGQLPPYNAWSAD